MFYARKLGCSLFFVALLALSACGDKYDEIPGMWQLTEASVDKRKLDAKEMGIQLIHFTEDKVREAKKSDWGDFQVYRIEEDTLIIGKDKSERRFAIEKFEGDALVLKTEESKRVLRNTYKRVNEEQAKKLIDSIK